MESWGPQRITLIAWGWTGLFFLLLRVCELEVHTEHQLELAINSRHIVWLNCYEFDDNFDLFIYT